MKITLLILLLGSLLGSVANARERVYTWTDQDGTVHFSDRPTGAQATPLLVQPPKANKPMPAQPEPVQDQGADDATATAQESIRMANPDEDPAVRKKNCEQSHRVVKSIEDSAGRRLFTDNDKGERHFFTDEERAAKLIEARNAVKKWCD
jgi:hypothetical protein